MSGQDGWAALARSGPARAVVGGAELRQGSRVRLRPRSRGDVLDLALVADEWGPLRRQAAGVGLVRFAGD